MSNPLDNPRARFNLRLSGGKGAKSPWAPLGAIQGHPRRPKNLFFALLGLTKKLITNRRPEKVAPTLKNAYGGCQKLDFGITLGSIPASTFFNICDFSVNVENHPNVYI